MTQYPTLHMIIGGEKVSGGGRRTHAVINPATGETLGDLPLAEPGDLDRALEIAAEGFALWRKSTPQERAHVLNGAARLMLERADDMARVATMEQGKPFHEAKIELMMNVGLFNFYAGECFRLYGRELVRPDGLRSTVRYEPVGPVAAFAPWNFPLGNPGRKLGAPIAAGCSVILKAAEETMVRARLAMDLGDQRARRIEKEQAAVLGGGWHRLRHAMCRKDHWRTVFWNLVELLHKYGAFGPQGFDHVPVVDDLVPDVDGGTEPLERQLNDLDGAIDAGTEAARRGQQDSERRARALSGRR